MNFDPIDEIIVNLKILSKLPRGGKLTTKDNTFDIEESSSYTTLIIRWWKQDHRISALNKIKKDVDMAVIIMMLYKEYKDNKLEIAKLETLVRELTNCMIGLENIKVTYAEDIKFLQQIDVIIEYIQRNLELYNDYEIEKEDSL
jgi:hypothetical protein